MIVAFSPISNNSISSPSKKHKKRQPFFCLSFLTSMTIWGTRIPGFGDSSSDKESEDCFSTLRRRWNLFSSPRVNPLLTGAALRNLGNTCFVNALVQVLIHTVPFVEAIRASDHQQCGVERFCCFCSFRSLMNECLHSSGKTIKPHVIVDNLRNISPSFEVGRQEDAHEFFCCFIDKLEESVQSLVKQVFEGHLRSQAVCSKCSHHSSNFERVLDLSLAIEHVDNLIGALELFTKDEKIEEFRCGACNEQVSAEKHLSLHQTPTVMVLHLKRFNENFEKIDRHVSYPMELDLMPFLSSAKDGKNDSLTHSLPNEVTLNNNHLKYDLYAVVMHRGSTLDSGHYFSCVRSSPDEWHVLDDDKVSSIPTSGVIAKEAYILFYVKQESSVWFSTLMKKLMTKSSPTCVLKEYSSKELTEADFLLADIDDFPVNINEERERDTSSNNIQNDRAGICAQACNPCSDYIQANQTTGCFRNPESPRTPASPKKRVLDVFSDETFEDDEQESYFFVPKRKEMVKRAREVEQCGGQMSDTLTSHMRQMPSSRRLALMHHLPPSLLSGSPNSRKRRLLV